MIPIEKVFPATCLNCACSIICVDGSRVFCENCLEELLDLSVEAAYNESRVESLLMTGVNDDK